MKTMNEVLQEVQQLVVDVLVVEPQEATPEARFFEDLNGESIELLDLSFRCERHFGIKAEFQKIGAAVKPDENGVLTPESLQTLRSKYPFLDVTAIEADPRADRVTELLTVGAIARYVYEALQTKEADDSAQPVPGLRPA